MYEQLTYDQIKSRMMAVIESIETDELKFDKRPGSIIDVALSPFAVESKNMFIAIDWLLKQMFADTADRECLIKHCAERGIEVQYATKAQRWITVTFSDVVAVSTAQDRLMDQVFNKGLLNYKVFQVSSTDDVYVFRCAAECDVYGTDGNIDAGLLTPVEVIPGLVSAVLESEVKKRAVDDEPTEELRAKYFRSFDVRFGGNVADYRDLIDDIDYVKGVKVRRAWEDGGYVQLYVQSDSGGALEPSEVEEIQQYVDPLGDTPPVVDGVVYGQGLGEGMAPIGHRVNVNSVEEAPIHVSAVIAYNGSWADVKQAIKDRLEEYYTDLRNAWEGDAVYYEDNDSNITEVVWAKVFTIILETDGVTDVSSDPLMTLRKGTGSAVSTNIKMDQSEVPVLGRLNEYIITGTVTDMNDDPIEGVEVVIGTGNGVTDENGNFEIETDGGSVAVTAKKTGYITYTDTVSISEDMTLNITLSQAVSVGGLVLDPNGDPIEGVHIVFTDGDVSYGDYTGDDGRFDVGVPTSGGSYNVSYSKDGYVPQTVIAIITEDTVLPNMVLESSEATPFVTLYDVHDQNIFFKDGAVVTLTNGQTTLSETTDINNVNGAAIFSDIPSGTYTLSVSNAGGTAVPSTVTVPDDYIGWPTYKELRAYVSRPMSMSVVVVGLQAESAVIRFGTYYDYIDVQTITEDGTYDFDYDHYVAGVSANVCVQLVVGSETYVNSFRYSRNGRTVTFDLSENNE